MSDTLEFNKLVDSAYDAFYNGSSEQLRAIFLRIKTLYAESVLARCDESKQAPAGTLNRDAIQQKALDCGFQYWRASDAHGVIATSAQAVDLLQDLLGVEVEIKEQAPAVEAGARDERAWEDYLDEQKRILGMPGLHSRPCFLAGYHAALARASEAATTDSTRERIAQALHYPACWDTAAYPTLESAVWESIACAKLGCSECGGASEAAAGEPVAYVPVHPRTGPLWANTVPTLDSERPEHYPVRALCYAAPQPASEQSSCPASWNAIVPPPNDSAPVFDGAQPASEQQGDDFIGILTVKRFRGADSMVNTDFEYLGNLPDGSYRCYLHPAEQQAASVAPSKRERLIKKVLKLLNEHGFVDPRDGYARVRGRGFAKNLVDTLAAKGDGQ